MEGAHDKQLPPPISLVLLYISTCFPPYFSSPILSLAFASKLKMNPSLDSRFEFSYLFCKGKYIFIFHSQNVACCC